MSELKDQLLAQLFNRKNEVYAMSNDPDEFDCLVGLIEDGTISSFDDLAAYGVKK